jgi:hypothetical protein
MTRDEALKIVSKAGWMDNDRFVNTLEALGLLKLDEPEKYVLIKVIKPKNGKIAQVVARYPTHDAIVEIKDVYDAS